MNRKKSSSKLIWWFENISKHKRIAKSIPIAMEWDLINRDEDLLEITNKKEEMKTKKLLLWKLEEKKVKITFFFCFDNNLNYSIWFLTKFSWLHLPQFNRILHFTIHVIILIAVILFDSILDCNAESLEFREKKFRIYFFIFFSLQTFDNTAWMGVIWLIMGGTNQIRDFIALISIR